MSSSLREVNLILGGPQGGGLETSMYVLTRALAYRGYGVIADREYYSNIVGRHSYIHMRISSTSIPNSLTYPVNIIAAMDAETIFIHFEDIADKGIVVYDVNTENTKIEDIASIEDELRERLVKKLDYLGVEHKVSSLIKYLIDNKDASIIGLDFAKILNEIKNRFKLDVRQLSRYVSGIITSAIANLLGLDEEAMGKSLAIHFKERKHLIEPNLELFKLVRKYIKDKNVDLELSKPSTGLKEVIVASGNEVVAMAKIISGVRYQSYYPITPAADESFFLEKYELSKIDDKVIGPIVVVQAEDEIAAINSVIGAALTGARSSTATSGPGFDLMVEGISWAGHNEVPIVVTYYQRGGPSTGLPTRGSQSDLFNALFASHGEFARIVLASGDHLEAFYDTIEAFNLAEKYQVPVIHLLDKFLANSIITMPKPNIDAIVIERGEVVDNVADYKRFDLSNLISPRAYLGSNVIMWYTGDEHNEYGHISEDSENRIKMYSKRIEKLRLIEEEVPVNKKFTVIGEDNPDYIIIGWGFVKGVAVDAIKALEEKKLKGAYINIRMLWPFPAKELREILRKVPLDKIIVAEHSYEALIANLISMTIGVKIRKKIVKFTGRPMTLNEFVKALYSLLTSDREKVILGHGA